MIVRIAHLSDFHLRHHLAGTSLVAQRQSRQMPALLHQAIAQISALQPDLLAITGDLVDYPLDALDDSATIAKGEQDLLLIRKIIEQAACPVAYLYGNHDHPARYRVLFADQDPDRTISDYRLLTFLDDEVRDNTAERLGASRQLFDTALADADPRPQIHLQHYMIFPEHNEGYPHSYREAADLQAAIATSCKVRLSLSGHFHQGADLQSQDGTCYATARAFCEAPHPYRIYDIGDTSVKQREYYVQPRLEN
ncbi:MAG TPA: hypothetical protein EYG11_09425 [Candidatus Latescibacteria bacterium]|nr:hypothetical protein [Candidatus Latescibacterota bacterium]